MRAIPNTNGLYIVDISTKEGSCISLNNKTRTPRKLSNKPYKNRISWKVNGKNSQAAVWVAITYPELVQNDYFEGAEIDHIDTDSMNNYPTNLRWVDRSGQMLNEKTREHLHEANTNNPKISKKVAQYTLDGHLVAVYPSIREASRQTGFDDASISRCCRGLLYDTVGGYVWRTI